MIGHGIDALLEGKINNFMLIGKEAYSLEE